ncbi:hypothetical protein F5B19DRAFT_162294 [Rostrohypoxylon terebratum]|nr:hypothetical protein F5B19DRAFT_162294 [Rostrohypoxylon terebratum]
MDRTVPITHQQSATPHNEAKFHQFSLLPLELRREIYILATPPRVVFVKEVGAGSQAWLDRLDEFREICRTTPIQFRLHPDLTYFASCWKPSIAPKLRSHNQLPLEAYGFTSTNDRYQPWVPTDDTPEIPSTWLADHPDTAWAMTRNASLHSPTPIPPFLHVCSESREVLKQYGYQLAFGTRTDEPHTWFHFERDTLYIEFVSAAAPNVLVDEAWDIGLFRPIDLLRIKRLAIKDGLRAVCRYGDQILSETSQMLRLVPNLRDLILVVWGPDDPPCDDTEPANTRDHHICISVDELDFMPLLPRGYYYEDFFPHTIYYRLKTFKRRNGPGSNLSRFHYFDYAMSQFQSSLHNYRTKLMSGNCNGPMYQCNVPRVHLAHMCTFEKAEYIFSERRKLWKQFNITKRRLARGRLSKHHATNEEADTIPKYMDVGEAFLRANEPDNDELRQFFIAHEMALELHGNYYYNRVDFILPVCVEEFWWLNNAVVFPPRFYIL